MENVILSILAHPDDAEFLCAGTLARLVREHGWSAHIASMTPGDCGSAELDPEEIAAIRREEGRAAAAKIGGTYHCLEERDLRIFYNEAALEKVIRLIREVRPRIVITHSPADYMLDHEMTTVVTRAAVFGAPMRNIFRERGMPALTDAMPHLYYADPIEGKDPLGRTIESGFAVDISGVLDVKRAMLCAHASQRDWLLKHHGIDHYVAAMEEWSARTGQRCGVAYAEGYRQHLGHSYPQDNLLGELLGERTVGL
jgi:LmbE family N-acetylglucosaminyl deacetylase